MNQIDLLQQFDNARFGKFHLALAALTGSCWLLAAYGVTIIGFLLPALRTEWQVSASELGLVASAGMLGMLIGSVLAGTLSDRLGRRNTLSWTLLYLGLVFGLSAAAWNYQALLILRLLTGVGLGAILPVSSTLISEFSPTRNRGALSVMMNACWGLGGTLAALAGYSLVLKFGWRPAMFIGSVSLLISPLVRFLLPESVRFLLSKGRIEQAQKEFARLHLQPAGPALPSLSPNSPAPDRADLKKTGIWSDSYGRITFSLWLMWIALNFLYQGAFIWLPTLLASAETSESHSFLMTLIISLGQLPGTLMIAFLVDRFSRRKLIILSLGLLSIVALLFGLSQGDAWVLIMGFLLMVFNGMAWGIAYPFSAELYPTRMRGKATGWANGIGRLGGVIAPLAVGWVVQAGGSLGQVFGMLACAPFLTALVLSSIKIETTARSLEEISSHS